MQKPMLVAIDPDVTWLATVIDALAPHFHIMPTFTLETGYSLVRQQHPELVIIEAGCYPDGLLGMSVLPALRELSHTFPVALCALGSLPHTDIKTKIAAYQAGADAFFVKNLPLPTLALMIQLTHRVILRYGRP